MVLHATLNIISVISWWSVLLVADIPQNNMFRWKWFEIIEYKTVHFETRRTDECLNVANSAQLQTTDCLPVISDTTVAQFWLPFCNTTRWI